MQSKIDLNAWGYICKPQSDADHLGLVRHFQIYVSRIKDFYIKYLASDCGGWEVKITHTHTYTHNKYPITPLPT